MNRRKVIFSALFVTFFLAAESHAKTCLLLYNSYNRGYEWHDKQEGSIENTLKDHCKLVRFYFDVKKNPSPEYAKAKGLEAKQLIEETKPDIVVTTDDDPVREVLVPYFKNSKIPFVFSAVKNSIDRFGLPYDNTTGIIAVTLVKSLVQEILKEIKDAKRIVTLSDGAEASKTSHKHNQKVWESFGIKLDLVTVSTFEQWKTAFLDAQKNADAIILGAWASVKDFDTKEAKTFVEKNAKKVIMGTAVISRPLTMFAIVRYPEEMGEWAADAAVKILRGASPKSISVTTNKRFDYYVNPKLMKKANIKLSDQFMKKAILPKE